MTDKQLREIARKHGVGTCVVAVNVLAALREAYEAGAGKYRQRNEELTAILREVQRGQRHDVLTRIDRLLKEQGYE